MLWGLQQISRGASAGFGTELRAAASRLDGKRITPVLTGCFIAATLQSSTATAHILAGFAGQGLLSSGTAFLAILGADLGTALAVVIASAKLQWLPFAALAVGSGLSIFGQRPKRRSIGKAINGIGLVLLSLTLLSQTLSTLSGSEAWRSIEDLITIFPAAAVILAVVLVYVTHSSLAIVLLATQLHLSGALASEIAYLIVVGANLGGSALPLLSSASLSRDGHLPLVANTVIKTLCSCLALLCMAMVVEAFETVVPTSFQVLAVHLGLNLLVLLIGGALASPILRLAVALLPEPTPSASIVENSLLDASLLSRPKQGLIAARREALRLADMVRGVMTTDTGRQQNIDEILRGHRELKVYVGRLMRGTDSDQQGEAAFEITDFAADVVEVAVISTRDLSSTDSHVRPRDVALLHIETVQALDLALHAFASKDPELALEYSDRYQTISRLADEVRHAHFSAIDGSGISGDGEVSPLDLARSYIAIASNGGAICDRVLTASGHVQKSKWKRYDKAKRRETH